MKIKSTIPYLLVFLSGFASLTLQLLWIRQLGLLFGNTAHAADMTLAIFFAGLAIGSWFWGGKSATVRNPMMTFFGLQVGTACGALLYFVILALFHGIYPLVYQNVRLPPLLFAVKALLACILILPPTFFMGGTVPMVVQAQIRDRRTFGARAAWLYALNTLGAALGALATGFYFVRLIGFTWTCILAIGLTAATAFLAFWFSQERDPTGEEHLSDAGDAAPPTKGHSMKRLPLYGVCFVSGFGFLTLEVVWFHLLAQIHTNSIYSFSSVLVIVLLALGLGAAVAARLARLPLKPLPLLAGLLVIGGFAIMLSPFVFMHATEGFRMLDTGRSFGAFMLDLLVKGTVSLGFPAFLLALIFPFLLKAAEAHVLQPGKTMGKLAAIDTIGSIMGALLCGFVFLGALGSWRTIQWVAALYIIIGLLMPIGSSKATWALRASGGALLILLFTLLSPVDMRVTGWNPARPPEEILDVWESSHGTVSVIRDPQSGYVIKLNSNYWLGSTGAAWSQHFQGRIPLLFFPETRSIFFLGMGTGMSAGGALHARFEQVERVIVSELIPDVVQAARTYMTGDFGAVGTQPVDYTSGLFEDPRVSILVEDGRQFLMASGETFDMINGDLFLPYERGAGSLYSREHFRNVKRSLKPEGVFVQWLPMFQLTEFEFGVIARTMLDVFDQVTIWRNNFLPGQEVVALVGHKSGRPLPAAKTESYQSRRSEIAGKHPLRIDSVNLHFDEESVLAFYIGNLTQVADLFQDYPINTDNRPVIEYTAPITITQKIDGFAPTLVGPRFVEFVDRIIAHSPPETDPMLMNRSVANRRLVRAGTELHRYWVTRAMQQPQMASRAWQTFSREWGNE